jgi:hypothetical protein
MLLKQNDITENRNCPTTFSESSPCTFLPNGLGSGTKSQKDITIVTCLLKTGIAEPEETAVARQWLCKHVSTATKSRDRGNRCTRDNRGTVGGGVLCWVCAEAIYREQKPIPQVSSRVQLTVWSS